MTFILKNTRLEFNVINNSKDASLCIKNVIETNGIRFRLIMPSTKKKLRVLALCKQYGLMADWSTVQSKILDESEWFERMRMFQTWNDHIKNCFVHKITINNSLTLIGPIKWGPIKCKSNEWGNKQKLKVTKQQRYYCRKQWHRKKSPSIYQNAAWRPISQALVIHANHFDLIFSHFDRRTIIRKA